MSNQEFQALEEFLAGFTSGTVDQKVLDRLMQNAQDYQHAIQHPLSDLQQGNFLNCPQSAIHRATGKLRGLLGTDAEGRCFKRLDPLALLARGERNLPLLLCEGMPIRLTSAGDGSPVKWAVGPFSPEGDALRDDFNRTSDWDRFLEAGLKTGEVPNLRQLSTLMEGKKPWQLLIEAERQGLLFDNSSGEAELAQLLSANEGPFPTRPYFWRLFVFPTLNDWDLAWLSRTPSGGWKLVVKAIPY